MLEKYQVIKENMNICATFSDTAVIDFIYVIIIFIYFVFYNVNQRHEQDLFKYLQK